MATEARAAGHLGNLTAEQEDCLVKLWQAVAKVCGFEKDATDGAPIEKTPSRSSQKPESIKKRTSFLSRWRSSESQEAESSSKQDQGDENDKYGQTKHFKKVLANNSPESIRKTIWDMVHHDDPDAIMLRFLRARKWDVQKALVMLISTVNWRQQQMHVDDDIIKKGEIGLIKDEKEGTASEKKMAHDFMAQARMGKCFIHGKDKEGRPICVIRVRLHKPGAQSNESLERYTVYVIETCRLMLDAPIETANIIFDMTGFGLANMDYHPVKFIIQCFEANYPECLGVILIHNAPWVFQGIWRIIRGWLDPVVAAKVHFTNYRAGLEEFIEPDNLIKELDGDEDWEYEYIEPAGNEDEIMKDTATRDKLLEERHKQYEAFEAATRQWIKHAGTEEGERAKEERRKIVEEMKSFYWKVDPYMRSRSLHDRNGELLYGGGAVFKNKATEKANTEEAAKEGQPQHQQNGAVETVAEPEKSAEPQQNGKSEKVVEPEKVPEAAQPPQAAESVAAEA